MEELSTVCCNYSIISKITDYVFNDYNCSYLCLTNKALFKAYQSCEKGYYIELINESQKFDGYFCTLNLLKVLKENSLITETVYEESCSNRFTLHSLLKFLKKHINENNWIFLIYQDNKYKKYYQRKKRGTKKPLIFCFDNQGNLHPIPQFFVMENFVISQVEDFNLHGVLNKILNSQVQEKINDFLKSGSDMVNNFAFFVYLTKVLDSLDIDPIYSERLLNACRSFYPRYAYRIRVFKYEYIDIWEDVEAFRQLGYETLDKRFLENNDITYQNARIIYDYVPIDEREYPNNSFNRHYVLPNHASLYPIFSKKGAEHMKIFKKIFDEEISWYTDSKGYMRRNKKVGTRKSALKTVYYVKCTNFKAACLFANENLDMVESEGFYWVRVKDGLEYVETFEIDKALKYIICTIQYIIIKMVSKNTQFFTEIKDIIPYIKTHDNFSELQISAELNEQLVFLKNMLLMLEEKITYATYVELQVYDVFIKVPTPPPRGCTKPDVLTNAICG